MILSGELPFNFLFDASPPLRSNFPLLPELLCLFAGDSDQHCSLLLLGFSFPVMKTLIRISAILILVQSAQADQFKVHYSVHGSGKNIIGNADSSSDARRTVQDMIPDAVVTGVNSNTEVIAFLAAS